MQKHIQLQDIDDVLHNATYLTETARLQDDLFQIEGAIDDETISVFDSSFTQPKYRSRYRFKLMIPNTSAYTLVDDDGVIWLPQGLAAYYKEINILHIEFFIPGRLLIATTAEAVDLEIADTPFEVRRRFKWISAEV